MHTKKKPRKVKKAARGRPKKPGGADTTLSLRLSRPALEKLGKLAKVEGTTRSKAAAALLLEALAQRG